MSTAPAPVANVPVTLTLGEQRVRLSQIDNTVWANNRKKMSEDGLIDLYKGIKNNGMMHNVVASWKADGTADLGLIAGFRRYEVSLWLALEKLFKDANNPEKYPNLVRPTMKVKDEATKTESEQPCNFDIGNKEHRKLLREQLPVEYKAALDDYTIAVKVVDCKDEVTASLLNIGENTVREDISVNDLCERVSTLLDKGVQGVVIAKGLGVDKSKVTHIKNIAEVPALLKTLAGNVTGMTETDATKHLELVNALITELNRRLSLVKEDAESISFSHARQLAEQTKKNQAIAKPGPLVDMLCMLCKLDKHGKPQKQTATPDYGVFMKEGLAACWAECEKMAAPPAPVAEAPATPTATSSDVAAIQNAVAPGQPVGTTNPAAPAPAVVDPNAAAVPAQPVPASGPVPTVAEGAAAAGVANEVDMGALTAGVNLTPTVAPTTPAVTAPTGADTGAKREVAPQAKYTVSDGAAIEAWAKDALETAMNAENPVEERYAQLQVAANCYQAIGMNTEYEFVAGKAAQFYADMQDFIAARDKWIVDAVAKFGGQGLAPFNVPAPQLVLE